MRSWVRTLHVSRTVLAAPKPAALVVLSCPAGTVLNLKIKKLGDEPVALEDAEYPEWLWTLLDKQKKDADLKEADIMKWRKRQLRKANIKRINNNNFLSKM